MSLKRMLENFTIKYFFKQFKMSSICKYTFLDHRDIIHNVKALRDNATFVSETITEIFMWKNGKNVYKHKIPDSFIGRILCVSPSGKSYLANNGNKMLCHCEIETKTIAPIHLGDLYARRAKFLIDESFFLLLNRQSIEKWSIVNGSFTKLNSSLFLPICRGLCLTLDNQSAILCFDKTIVQLNVNSFKEEFIINVPVADERLDKKVVATATKNFLFCSTNWVLTKPKDSFMKIYDLKSKRLQNTLQYKVRFSCLNRSEYIAAFDTADSNIDIFTLNNTKRVRTLCDQDVTIIDAIEFLSSNILVSAKRGRAIRIWQLINVETYLKLCWVLLKKRTALFVVIDIINFFLSHSVYIDFDAEANFLPQYKLFLVSACLNEMRTMN